MGKRILGQYRGSLSAAKIANGINAANSNAKRLADDARLLLEAGRFPSASSLAALAIEESGKATILRGMSLAANDKEVMAAWREFRSHTHKNADWIIPDLVVQGARKLDDFLSTHDKNSSHPQALEEMKQVGFYLDCNLKGTWIEPQRAIKKQWAEQLLKIAEIFTQNSDVVTAKEIVLWRKYISPVKNTTIDLIKQAFQNWYAEMQRRGLKPQGENVAEAFVKGTIKPNRNTH